MFDRPAYEKLEKRVRELENEAFVLRQAKISLKKERDNALQLLDIAGSMILTLDIDGRVTFLNKKGCDILEYDQNDVIGKDWFQNFLPENAREEVKAIFNRIISGEIEGPKDVDGFSVVAKSGKETSLYWHNSIIKDESNNIVGILSSAEDVTKRKQAEEKRRESDERFRIAQEISPDGFTILRPVRDDRGRVIDFTWVYENEAVARMNGTDPEKVVGQRLLELFPGHQGTQFFNAYKQVAETGAPITFEDKYVGETIEKPTWFRIVVVPMAENIAIMNQDITERKSFEKALLKSEHRFRQLFENMLDGFALHEIICDNKGRPVDYRFLAANSQFEKLTGLTSETILGKTVLEILPNTEKSWIEKYGHVALEGESIQFENYSKELDRHFLVSAYRPAPQQFACVFRDITKRKQAESALKKQNYYLEKAQELGQLGTWELDLANNILVWTDQNCRIFGVPEGSVVDYETFLDKVHPDDRQYVDREWKAGVEGKPYDIEHRLLLDGEVKWVREKADLKFDDNGNAVSAIGFTQDITDRKIAERETLILKSAIDQAPVGIALADETINIYYCNPEGLGMRGGNIDDLVKISKDAFKNWQVYMLNGEPYEIDRLPLVRAIRTGTTIREDFIVKHQDGTRHVCDAFACPVFENGKVIAGMVIFLDVTERKRMEAELRQAQKMEAIGTLSGGIAHDFNNILSIILGNLDLAMIETADWSPAYHNLKEIRIASLRARDIVQQLLTFSRKSDENNRPVDISKMIKECIHMLRASIPASVKITLDLDDSLPSVLAPPEQIHQIFMNTCTNSYQAMSDGEGAIIIRAKLYTSSDPIECLHRALPAGSYIRMTITDDGQGIAENQIEKVFDPYFTTKRVGKGTGLGLATVYGIVQNLNGGIAIYSELGHGTTIDIFLPPTDQLHEVEKNGILLDCTGRESLLFVDDEEAITILYKQLLERYGYTVTTANNSVDALNLFKKAPNRFDLVITDMAMPGMTGASLAKSILAIRPEIPIILCTGFSDFVDERSAEKVGVKAYLSKPVDKDTIAETIRRLLDEQ